MLDALAFSIDVPLKHADGETAMQPVLWLYEDVLSNHAAASLPALPRIRPAVTEHGATLSFVVENGCANGEDIRPIFNVHKAHPSLARVMGRLDFAEKKSTIALQTADFLAYQSRRYVAECEARRGDYAPMPDTLMIMTDRIFYRDAVATGFNPTKPATAA
jgi:hypothetical protein